MLSGPVVAAGRRGPAGDRGLPRAGRRHRPDRGRCPGTIRGDLGRDWGLKVQQNLVHGSDSPESAAREIGALVPRS